MRVSIRDAFFLLINNKKHSMLGFDFCANGANLTNKKF